MSARTPYLDISALSPQEWAAYENWSALIDTLNGKISRERMLRLVAKAIGFKAYDNVREDEILDLLDPSTTVFTTGTFLAILRLIAHGRTCSVLCRDHVFIQTQPLRLIPASLGGEEEVIDHASNPFRPLNTATARDARSMNISVGESSNPFRNRSTSGQAVSTKPSATPALSTATSSYVSVTPSTVHGAHISPPLPPRPKQKTPIEAVPLPPPRMSLLPPPRESSKTTAALPTHTGSFEVIATSVVAPSPRRPRISPSSLLGSSSQVDNRFPLPVILPKPKLVSSTHIGPSTRMRPVTPQHTASFSDGGASATMERSASGSLQSIQKPPSLSSSSSDDDEEISRDSQLPPAPPPRPLPLAREKSLRDRPQTLPPPPPPPPKRRVSLNDSAPEAALGVTRSQSLRYSRSNAVPNASSSVANQQNRPLDSFLPNASATAQEWIDRARRRATMPALNSKASNKLALMSAGTIPSGDEPSGEELDDDDENYVATANNRSRMRQQASAVPAEYGEGWSRLR